MHHPLHGLSGNADFEIQNIVDDNQDSSKSYGTEDFGTYAGEGFYDDENMAGFESHPENYAMGGWGKKFKKKFKKISKSAGKLSKLAKKNPIAKAISKSGVAKQISKIQAQVSKLPVLKQAAALHDKVKNLPIPGTAKNAISAGVSSVLRKKKKKKNKSKAAPQAEAIVQETPSLQVSAPTEIVAAKTGFSHPMLYVNQKIKGAPMGGFMDDMLAQIKVSGQKIIDQNKAKAIEAATTQASNLVGKTLTKLNTSSPSAQAAIQNLVNTAATSAQTTATQKASLLWEQNKNKVYIGGAIALGAILFLKFGNSKKAA